MKNVFIFTVIIFLLSFNSVFSVPMQVTGEVFTALG
jgi:hypothetical protein